MARGVGPATVSALRAAFADDEAIVAASPDELAERLELTASGAIRLAAALRGPDPWDEHRRTRRGGAVVLGPDDVRWPPLLRLLEPGVPALWCRGAPPAEDRTVAIVGARRADEASLRRAGELAAALGQDGWVIVSGGALGVDAAAHRGALRAGARTIVVLGGGLSRPAPASHDRLFREVVAAGGTLLSEWPMGTEAQPGHFPRRNRVIAGIARAVLVVAAGQRSGAHITARISVEELGRDVGAIPGRPEDDHAAGCLRLIREGAAVIRDVDDARELLAGTEALVAAGDTARPPPRFNVPPPAPRPGA